MILFNSYTKLSYLLITVLLAMSISCAQNADKTAFDQAVVMASSGKQEQALPILESLCAKNPDNQDFCTQAENVKQDLYEQQMSQVRNRLSAEPPIPYKDIEYAETRLDNAKKYGVNEAEIDKYTNEIQKQRELTAKAVKEVQTEADRLINSGKPYAGYNKLSSIRNLAPELVDPLIDTKRKEIYAHQIAKVESMAARDEWVGVEAILARLLEITPGDEKAQRLLAESKEKGRAEYYIKRAEEMKQAGEYEKALSYYEGAAQFPGAKAEVEKLAEQTRIQLVEDYFLGGVELVEQELYRQAYEQFDRAFELLRKLPPKSQHMVNIPRNDLEYYYNNLFFIAGKAEENYNYGAAYFFYSMIAELSPNYPDIKLKMRNVTNKILERSMKSIAVIPFKTPASAPEMGGLITSNIMLSMHNELSGDVRIIERGAVEVLMREYELAVAGNITQGNSGDLSSFQIQSADYLLMGEVLDADTETSVQDSMKKVRVQVGTEKIRNIEYDDWVRESEKLKAEQKPVPPAPEKYIEKPVYEYVEYDISYYEKTSYATVSYRVVETSRGNIIYNNTAKAKVEAKDESSGGVELGSFKVPMKVADLPTDIEMSNRVQASIIKEITGNLQKMFTNPEKQYVAQAQKLEAEGNINTAIERYADAIVLMERKGLETAPLEMKAGKYLDVYTNF
ncbi:hypothetical protein [Limisalsivibrio acetivorans]|uniref:hypothetical protein n=1 Tax=Limisalsivibrio acetivorans TaxID=1304888 RepID=UPI0003B4B9AC|nr:hypothetical protein [Limisalsivibrio acetivorans]